MGGLVLVIAWSVVQGWIALRQPELRDRATIQPGVILASIAMFLLGFWDDVQPLGPRIKLAGQVLIAIAVSVLVTRVQWLVIPFSGRTVDLGPWGLWITVIWLVGVTNLINLIDGIDGLAGGISLVAVVFMALGGWTSGVENLLLCGLAGALLGFLLFNFPPARIFLGDSGAYFLGFQIAMGSILSSRQGFDPLVMMGMLLVLAVPVIDALLAILRRGVIGLPVLRPDRRHIHHHLLKRGCSPRRAVLCLYAVTFLMFGPALLIVHMPSHRWLLWFGIAGMPIFFWLLTNGWLKFGRGIRRRVAEALSLRVQIQYGFALARGLKLAGARCQACEEIWDHLTFAASQLGFASVQLSWPGGDRSWGNVPELGEVYAGIFRPHGTLACQLALSAKVTNPRQRLEFELLGELLAEAWINASERWIAAKGATASSARDRGRRFFDPVWVSEPIKSFMKSAMMLLLLGIPIGAATAIAGENPSEVEFARMVRRVPLPELPLVAAQHIQAGKLSEREALTTNVVRIAAGINPSIGAPLVGSIAQLIPDMTEVAAAAAVAEVPKEARAITRAAVAAAPSRTETIVASLCARRPDQCRAIALAAAESAPTAGREILRGVARARPELETHLEPFLTGDRRAPSVVQHALDQIERLRQAEAAQHSSTGITAAAEPGHSVTLGASAITNDSRLIRGGRNYARP